MAKNPTLPDYVVQDLNARGVTGYDSPATRMVRLAWDRMPGLQEPGVWGKVIRAADSIRDLDDPSKPLQARHIAEALQYYSNGNSLERIAGAGDDFEGWMASEGWPEPENAKERADLEKRYQRALKHYGPPSQSPIVKRAREVLSRRNPGPLAGITAGAGLGSILGAGATHLGIAHATGEVLTRIKSWAKNPALSNSSEEELKQYYLSLPDPVKSASEESRRLHSIVRDMERSDRKDPGLKQARADEWRAIHILNAVKSEVKRVETRKQAVPRYAPKAFEAWLKSKNVPYERKDTYPSVYFHVEVPASAGPGDVGEMVVRLSDHPSPPGGGYRLSDDGSGYRHGDPDYDSSPGRGTLEGAKKAVKDAYNRYGRWKGDKAVPTEENPAEKKTLVQLFDRIKSDAMSRGAEAVRRSSGGQADPHQMEQDRDVILSINHVQDYGQPVQRAMADHFETWWWRGAMRGHGADLKRYQGERNPGNPMDWYQVGRDAARTVATDRNSGSWNSKIRYLSTGDPYFRLTEPLGTDQISYIAYWASPTDPYRPTQVPRQKLPRQRKLSPEWLAMEADIRRGWTDEINEMNQARWAQGVDTRKRNPSPNPSPDAQSLYETFHGVPSEEELVIHSQIHEHEHLTSLGLLTEIQVKTPTGYLYAKSWGQGKTNSPTSDIPFLASSEDGRQLFVEGGDQSVDLHKIKMDTKAWLRDSMIIGEIVMIQYRTRKSFDGMKETDYFHKLSEESKQGRPVLVYDSRSQLMSISGGQYHIEVPLVGVSRGIIN